MLLGRGHKKVIDSETLINEVRKRVSKSLREGYSYEGITEYSEQFLRKHVLDSVKVATLYIDLVGSTSVILKLPKEKLAVVLSTFAQEMAYVIKRHDGYVLKFVGDAVIGYFVDDSSQSVCNSSVSCAESMIKVLKLGINPILEENGLFPLQVKIGIDHGEVVIVRYGDDPDKDHVDLLGPSINIAAKIQALAQPDQIMIGSDVYERLHDSIMDYFVPLTLSEQQWNYRSRKTGKIYRVYSYVGK